jgi:hypothetical protein
VADLWICAEIGVIERLDRLAAAESSGGVWRSVNAPIGLFFTALARWSPKVSIGI